MQRHPFLSDEEQRLRNYSLGGQTSRSIVAKKTRPCLVATRLHLPQCSRNCECAGCNWCRYALACSDAGAWPVCPVCLESADSFIPVTWLFVLNNCSCYVNHPAGGFAVTHPRRLFSFPFPFLVFALAATLCLLRNAWFLDIIADWLHSSPWFVTTFNMISPDSSHDSSNWSVWSSYSREIIVPFKDSFMKQLLWDNCRHYRT